MPKANTRCIVCGKEFYASPGHKRQGWGKYCSMLCRSKAMTGENNPRYDSSVPDRICKNCGKQFRKKPFAVARGEGIFCSAKCKHDYKGTSKICPVCKNEFWIYSSLNVDDKRKYCSIECAKIGRTPKNNCTCIVCGIEFHVKPNVLSDKKRKGGGSFCSIECKARYMSSNPRTTGGVMRKSKYKGGKRDDIGIYVRSSWEANYARLLNWMKEKGQIDRWEYEPDTFEFPVKRGSKFYTPDFKVWAADGSYEYHEVKGYMDPKSKTKLKRMGIHHKGESLKLIDAKAYRKIDEMFGSMIPGWEH